MATSKFGKAFAAARKEKGAGKTFTFEGKSYSTNMASDKPNATAKKPDVAKRAEAAIDKASPTRPQSRPTGTRPQSRPTATTPVAKSASVPSVTTSSLAPTANTLKGYTWDQYIKGNNLGRLRAGVPMDIRSEEDFLKKAAEEVAANNAPKAPSSVATRRSNRNYNKGGMVNKSNCGASVPPSKKR
jgi:hypothetical protein